MPYEVNIVIKADSDLGEVKTAEQVIQKLAQTSSQTHQRMGQDAQRGAQLASDAYQKHERGALSAQKALGPLAAAISQSTQLLRQQSPALGAAAAAIDGLAVSALATAASVGGLSGAMRVITGLLSPWTLAAVAGGAAIAALAAHTQEAKTSQEEFNRALQTGDLTVLRQRAKDAADELARVERELENIIALQERQNAPPGSPLARAQEAGLEQFRQKVREASRASAQADRDVAKPLEDRLKAELPHIEKRLELQRRLAQASERQRPLIEAEAAAAELLAKGYTEEQIAKAKLELRSIGLMQIREIDLKTLREESQGHASALKSLLSQEQAVRAETIAFRDGAAASEAYKINLIEQALAQEVGAASAKAAADAIRKKLGVLQEDRALEQQRLELAKAIQIAGQELDRQHEEELSYLTRKNQLLQAGQAFELEKLRAQGAPEAVVLQRQLDLLRQQKEAFLNAPKEPGQLQAIERQIELTEIRLQQVGKVTIDIGHAVANTLTDIAHGLATGTLKGIDVVKAGGAALLNFTTDIFRQTLQKKLSFELDLFNNLRGLPGQMQGALNAGGASIGPLNGGGGGGLIQNLLGAIFGGGSNPGLFSSFPTASGITQLDLANTTFSTGSFSGGGGFGSIFSSIGSGLSNFLPAGSTLGGLLGAGFGGFGIGQLINPTTGGGIGGLVGGIGGSLIGSSTAIGTALGLSGSLTSGITSALTSVLGGTLGGLIGAFAIPGIGAVIGALISLLAKPKPPRTRANAATTFGGISLGPLGLELGAIDTVFGAKGPGSKKLGDVGGNIEGITGGALGGIVGALNLLPREILQGLPFGNFTGAIGQAASFNINARSTKFSKVLNEMLAEIPANIFHVMQPLFKQAIEEQVKRLGFSNISAQAGAFITAINPLFNAPQGPNEPKLRLTEQAVASLGGVIQFLNTLEGIRPFTSTRERGLLESGAGQVLGAGLDTQKSIERFGQQFGGVLQAAQERQRFLSDIVSQSIAAGLGEAAVQGAGFDFFFRSFGDAFSKTIQDSMARAFLEQQIQPLIAGRFADIVDIFSGIGQGRTAEEALGLAQPQITSLIGELGALRPVFDAMLQLIRDLQGQLRGEFGGKSSMNVEHLEIRVDGSQDPRDTVRAIEEFFRQRRTP